MAKRRKEFDSKYKWNVKDLFESDEEALKALKNIEERLPEFRAFKGHILESAHTLKNLLELDTEISITLERLYIYGHINNDADTLDIEKQELFGKIKNVYVLYCSETSFIVPELLQSDYEVIEKYINELDDLKSYERSLKEIFRGKMHVLKSEVEEALSYYGKLMDAPDEIMSSLSDSDFKFDDIIVDGKKEELTESNFSIYIRHPEQSVRKMAFLSLYKTYKNFKYTIATILKHEVDMHVVNARLRGYPTSLEASLFHNEIDKSVYTNLCDAVHQNLDVLYKYFALKKKSLNLKEMHIYDTYASLFDSENLEYTFEEAKDLVLKIVAPLGAQYQNNLKKAFNEGWIDSCNNEGKRGGAYCTACYSVHPYVLLSFEGKLNDVSTLAHELGHAMHYYYACQEQSFQDYGYSIFVAEVASQVNEILLCRYLLDHSTKKSEKLNIIDDLLQKYKSTIFRQTMFAEFELYIHDYAEKGGILTSQNMCDKYYELNKLYFGDNVIIDDDIRYEWERIPHFYMNFYVYQYATGFAAAVNIANKIYEGDEETRKNYLEFLKLGATKNPIESLKVAGQDLTKNDTLTDAIKFMNKLIEEYEELEGSE